MLERIFAELGPWNWMVLGFALLALACAFAGNRLMGGRRPESDQPLLNRRAEQFVGRVVTLAEPIRDGRGRLQLDDTVWRISGPDLPAGARVRVAKVASSELELIVEAA